MRKADRALTDSQLNRLWLEKEAHLGLEGAKKHFRQLSRRNARAHEFRLHIKKSKKKPRPARALQEPVGKRAPFHSSMQPNWVASRWSSMRGSGKRDSL